VKILLSLRKYRRITSESLNICPST